MGLSSNCFGPKKIRAPAYWYMQEYVYGFIEFEISNGNVSTAFRQPLEYASR